MMEGFEAMAEHWRDRVNTFGYYTLGNREDAEDVSQDVMLRLWEHWSELAPRDATGWIIRVARNACLDRLRRRRTRREALVAHGETIDVELSSHAANNPDTLFEVRERHERVQRALQSIEEPYRTILILRDIQDRSCAEIAQALDMTPNAVRVRSHRGRRMLREELKKDSPHDTI